MYNYNLLGAVMVFVDPSGLMHPYWTLTLHGFIWHILLIFIGLLIAFSRMVLPTAKGFWQSTAVFAVGCVIATIINVTSHPYGNADMFYITPYYATTQIVYSQIAAKFGIFCRKHGVCAFNHFGRMAAASRISSRTSVRLGA